MTAAKTVPCAIVFSALLLVWALAYMLEGGLDRALVWLVNRWPEC
jgi:hypothetical protein